MAAQRLVHPPVHHLELGRVEPQKVRRNFGDPGACSRGIRRQIGRPQRADLAVTGNARIRTEGHHCRIEHLYRIAARPFVAALVKGQFDSVGADSNDPHRCLFIMARFD